MTCVSKGLIVGGGIAGLAAAIALQRCGVQCHVVDLDMKPIGAGIGFAGRAPQALEELGIYDEVYATGKPFTDKMKAPVTRDQSGAVIGSPPSSQEFPGAKPPVGVHRPVFSEILLRKARAMGARVDNKVSITSIAENQSSVAVTFTNGEVGSYDFLIGADGINSRVRSLVFPDAPEPEYAGQMSIRWLAPFPAIPEEDWYSAGRCGKVAIHNMPLYDHIYVPMVFNMPDAKLSQDQCYEVVDQLLSQFTAPAIVELRKRLMPDSELIPRPFKWLLLDSPWHRGRVLLIGDAAHATTAHMGMGGGMALEDAVVLAQCIGSASTLEEAFGDFMKRRFERVRVVVETSVALSKIEQTGVPPGEDSRTLMAAGMAALSSPY